MPKDDDESSLTKLARQEKWGPPRVPKNQVEEWLKEKWKGNLACPVCQVETWVISDDYIQLAAQPGTIQLGPRAVYLSVQLICTNCGYVMLFNWGIILHGKKEPGRG